MKAPGDNPAAPDFRLDGLSAKPPTREEERVLIRWVQRGDPRSAASALDQICRGHLRFVIQMAYQMRRRYGGQVADYVQEGTIGLMHAVKRFNPDRQVRLLTFAVHWIRVRMMVHVTGHSVVRVATSANRRRAYFMLAQIESMIPNATDADLADALNISVDDVQAVKTAWHGIHSLDSPVGGDEDHGTFLDFVEDRSASPEEQAEHNEIQAKFAGAVRDALADFDERDRAIVVGRLMADKPLTLKQLGDEFGVSRERMRQLEMRLRWILKRRFRAARGIADLISE